MRHYVTADEAVAKRAGTPGPSRYAEIASAAGMIANPNPAPVPMVADGEEKEGSPFGFAFLYGLSAVPIFITIAAVGIMFVNSLQ